MNPDDLIYAYTRAQALTDGVLIDVSAQAGGGPDGMLGRFACPVAVTAALWAAIGAIPKSLDGIADTRGRLHDVLWMARVAAAQGGADRSALRFRVILPYRGTRKRTQTLVVHVGPDDAGGPCITIGFPEDF